VYLISTPFNIASRDKPDTATAQTVSQVRFPNGAVAPLYRMGIVYEKLSSIFTTELHKEFPEPEYFIHYIPTFEDMYKAVLRFSSTRNNDSLY
jgi:hypothetical protein